MALRPQIYSIEPFCVSEKKRIRFSWTGNKIDSGAESKILKLYNGSSTALIATIKANGTTQYVDIPANTLDGLTVSTEFYELELSIKVDDAWYNSQRVKFQAFEIPEVIWDKLPDDENVVRYFEFDISVNYAQEFPGNEIVSWQYSLLQGTKGSQITVQKSNTIYKSSDPFRISGLIYGNNYTVECECTTARGFSFIVSKDFVVMAEREDDDNAGSISYIVDECTGLITITSNIVVTIYKPTNPDDTLPPVNERGEADLRGLDVTYTNNKGLDNNKDFSICTDLFSPEDGERILSFSDGTNTAEVYYYEYTHDTFSYSDDDSDAQINVPHLVDNSKTYGHFELRYNDIWVISSEMFETSGSKEYQIVIRYDSENGHYDFELLDNNSVSLSQLDNFVLDRSTFN